MLSLSQRAGSCWVWCAGVFGRVQHSVQAFPPVPGAELPAQGAEEGLERGAAGTGPSAATAGKLSPRVTGERNFPRLGARGRAGAGAHGGGMRGCALPAGRLLPRCKRWGAGGAPGRGGRWARGACAERGAAGAASGTRPGPADSRRPRGPARPGLAGTWAARPRRARGGSGGSCRRSCRRSCCCSRRLRHRYGRRWERGLREGGTAPGKRRGVTVRCPRGSRCEPVLACAHCAPCPAGGLRHSVPRVWQRGQGRPALGAGAAGASRG